MEPHFLRKHKYHHHSGMRPGCADLLCAGQRRRRRMHLGANRSCFRHDYAAAPCAGVLSPAGRGDAHCLPDRPTASSQALPRRCCMAASSGAVVRLLYRRASFCLRFPDDFIFCCTRFSADHPDSHTTGLYHAADIWILAGTEGNPAHQRIVIFFCTCYNQCIMIKE